MNEFDKTFAELNIGDRAEFTKEILQDTIKKFAEFSEDKNPLHTDYEYAKNTVFGGVVAHGMIVGALFSRLIGMYLPGKYSLYLRQVLNFHAAITPDAKVLISGEIIKKTPGLNLVTLNLRAADNETQVLYVEGEALVKVLK